ncbi:hypothetical protein HanIR_Chr15g0732791 [Helianthus annuus]|nr:hypothetical protein HanIR_Chr15g0732791 [Helianthus annuus]
MNSQLFLLFKLIHPIEIPTPKTYIINRIRNNFFINFFNRSTTSNQFLNFTFHITQHKT